MAPTSSIAASQLSQLIYYHLDNELLDTANFLAGRLHALEPRNPDSAHLLSLTYFRLRRYKASYDFSHKFGSSGRQLGCAYIFAQSCLQLGRYTEGVSALEKSKVHWVGKLNWKKHSETTRRSLPDAPACYTLLAKLWQGHGDSKKAGDCYIEAHKSNPFIWDAFEGLCKVGADLKVENMFRLPESSVSSSGTATGSGSGAGTEIYTDEAPVGAQPLAQLNFNQQVLTPSGDPFNTSKLAGDAYFGLPNMRGKGALQNGVRPALTEWDTPTANGGAGDEDVPMGGMPVDSDEFVNAPPAAPARRMRPTHHSEASDRPRAPALRGHTQSSSETTSIDDSRKPSIGAHKRTISGAQPSSQASTDPSAPPRRSNRLFGQTGTTRTTRSAADATSSLAGKVDRTVRAAKAATGAKGRAGSTVGRVVSGNRKMMPPDPADAKEKDRRAPSRTSEKTAAPGVTSTTTHKSHSHPVLPPSTDIHAEQQAISAVLGSLRTLAIGSYSTARFELPAAIQTFRTLPSAQRESPYVLAQLGKAYYEAASYHEASKCFARLLKIQPSRVEDMEVYSTVLWHLKKQNELAYLCHLLKDLDYEAPETWCAVGNAFSLSREHDQAISAFKRATQIAASAPSAGAAKASGAGVGCEAYAWTLMGHEYIANEDFDTALSSFRHSIAVDRRNYGGWYGLGKPYERLGKFDEAERHYRIAASINPSNATLLVCIGVVLERLQNKKAALANYTKALELAPTSALARFKKARVLMGMRYFSEALVELEVLRDQAPDEANVWFLLGKCYKGLGEKSDALRALTTALNLDVKAAPFIKEAMEALDDEDEESEED